MKHFLYGSLLLVCISCAPERITADLLVKNANIYTVNHGFDTATAIVVQDGKILEIGLKPELELKYNFKETFDAKGKTIVPGLIDAHAHLFGLGLNLQDVDLVDTKSFDEVVARVVAFQKEHNKTYIIGRGWDQNDWEVKEFPTREVLDSLFPDTPVSLRRIDGHAMLVNNKALELAGVTANTKVPGGEVIVKDGAPTGVLIDGAMQLVSATFPKVTKKDIAEALLDAENLCLEMGLTTVNDAGLSREVIETIDSLQKAGTMQLRVYAMVSGGTPSMDHYLTAGKLKTDRLNVRSIKIYGDGALGSRGAAMREPYSDQPGHYGLVITNEAQLRTLADRISAAGFQMNTHAIGDSANVSVLRVYSEVLKDQKDPRWKVEHAQIVTPSDFDYFSEKIIPSVQPTHATSDMYWAEDRVGPDRIEGAYAYKSLLERSGTIALGTDFPVERVNPMYTFYAAVARKDLTNYPADGYRMEESLTREETLKGMTLWAAYSNFEESEKGSIEKGKFADFTVLEQDIMTIPADSIPKVKVNATFINGQKVFERSN
ncbi:amidohydrolase [Altibacter lentus]|uniref:amidohydrolase n=1 Tax=Altibacter lentus TaxID=1223410 RepID=UPI00055414DF|nr:amidohydrolase [Altibacter lentus]